MRYPPRKHVHHEVEHQRRVPLWSATNDTLVPRARLRRTLARTIGAVPCRVLLSNGTSGRWGHGDQYYWTYDARVYEYY